jgi:Lipopolysaccharide-assembly
MTSFLSLRLTLLVCFVAAILNSCAGYSIQGKLKPQALQGVKRIHIPLFENDTLMPRADVMATNSMTDAISLDGTYTLATTTNADAILRGKLHSIRYNQVRATRLDTLRSEEMQNIVTLNWELVDARNPIRIIATGTATGSSRFAIDANQQTARNNALPDAMQRACKQIIGRLTDDF